MQNLKKSLMLFALLSVGISGSLLGHIEHKSHGKGMHTATPEHIQYIEKEWPQIIHVSPNKIGFERIKNHQTHQGRTINEELLDQEEIITNRHARAEIFHSYTELLPPYVNNSLLPSFPPIGDQGQEGSCVAFASTYYQASHEIGLMNGFDNKNNNTHVLSPKWTYNMLNDGGDNGANPPDAFTLLSQNGAVSIAKLPYIVGDFLSWDVKTDDWISAMSNRTNNAAFVTGIGGDVQDLTQIKHLLNNGHVLTFATFVEDWQFTKIMQNPAPNADNRFAGQYAASWMNGTDGGHFITIVGYNDDIWIDVNGNGQIDPGEMGAFLIANSWGNEWGNNGFIWVAYDAFLATSAVPNGPNNGRVPLAAAMNNYVVNVTGKSPHYQPVLIAEFELVSTARSQIGVSAGVSTNKELTPIHKASNGALFFQGGPYAFDGSRNKSSAVFALDLTDLIDHAHPNYNRFYLIVNDNHRGNPTTIRSYSLIDLQKKKTAHAPHLPKTIDNQQLSLHIDYDFTATHPPHHHSTSHLATTEFCKDCDK